MRLIGNKTHGDLAEIAMAEFINQYMYDFRSEHVGKELYRSKSHEEDIKVINEITNVEFPVSLKAYGSGPLQLSTDKNSMMFQRLQKEKDNIEEEARIRAIYNDPAFATFGDINILPLIYDEKQQKCSIIVFDYSRAVENTRRVTLEASGKGRKHPVYRFYDSHKDYICEVRYGDSRANALQRGLWTDTKRGAKYFNSITNGWIDYSHNFVLLKLFSHSLVSSSIGHSEALDKIKADIEILKQKSGLIQ
jgi:predicted Ser/Thr protein kinase